MSEVIFKERTGRVAAIYARVSSERQRQDETIQSQTVGLRELAAERGLLLPDDLVFEDEGFSGATLQRPALERLRDRAAEGAFEVLLCHAPDRLARRYAYQVLLLEEFARVGVEVCFAKEPERGASPEDQLLRQFQGMIAEYERAQIRERTRRGKLHRARTGHQAVLSCAPYGYRYVKKTEHSEGFWEIDPVQAEVVREVFARYVEGDVSIGELARWLTERGIPTRTGKAVWDRSSVWAMLRNTAYRGQAAFGKTKTLERHGKPTRTTRVRGERHGRRAARADQPAEKWTLIGVPAIVTEETFELAQARLSQNAHFAKRNTKRPTLLQGILVCRECGYGCYRTTTRTTNKRIYYYRCIGSDNYRHIGGRVCHSRPIRADELDELVWGEVRRLLQDPALVRAEIDRRLTAARSEHPVARRRESLERDITRAEAAITRLIEAYQEQLLSLEELRARMPGLRSLPDAPRPGRSHRTHRARSAQQLQRPGQWHTAASTAVHNALMKPEHPESFRQLPGPARKGEALPFRGFTASGPPRESTTLAPALRVLEFRAKGTRIGVPRSCAGARKGGPQQLSPGLRSCVWDPRVCARRRGASR